MIRTTLCLGFATALLSGCIETSTSAPAAGSAVPAGNTEEQAAVDACLRDVRATTGNPAVSVLSSSFSQAGTEVMLQVGPTGTWRCIGYADGTTAGIMSTTDEGAL